MRLGLLATLRSLRSQSSWNARQLPPRRPHPKHAAQPKRVLLMHSLPERCLYVPPMQHLRPHPQRLCSSDPWRLQLLPVHCCLLLIQELLWKQRQQEDQVR